MSFDLAVRSDSHVLVTGPTGSGKSRLAHKIHSESVRKEKPYIVVNLATLHEGILESELFGHEKGAFTGADKKRIGKLEQANKGTVFLDEIAELSPRMQARLLDFVQTKNVTPVGGNEGKTLDVRVIAATQKDLKSLVRRGEFRSDLYFRLCVISIELKSLLDRAEEFDAILHACLEEVCQSVGKAIFKVSEEVACLMENYRWPGNIRELRNVLEYAVLACPGVEIAARDLPPWFLHGGGLSQKTPLWEAAEIGLDLDYQSAISEFEKVYLKNALKRYRGRINKTSKMIGISKATLIRRIRAYELFNEAS